MKKTWTYLLKTSLVFCGLFSLLIINAQNLTVSGVVTDSSGTVLPGVSVSVQGANTGTTTNAEGAYSVTARQNAVLIFSSIGYQTLHEVVTGPTLNVTLANATTAMIDEVVVVGYGTQRRVNVTGSVSTVSSRELEKRPVTNVSQALQGVAAGLNVTTNAGSGEPGGRMNFNIRGAGSINGGGPYVLVDGIEQDINQVNPNDIENISVLKDAAASAIYGARAPYGVILITTKSGKAGRFSIDYNNNFAFSTPTNLPKMMNSLDFANYWNAASVNDGNAPIFSDNILDSIRLHQKDPQRYPGTFPKVVGGKVQNSWASYTDGAYANTDWFSEFYKKWTPMQTHNLSFAGGTDKTRFYIGGGLFDQVGYFKVMPDNFRRYTLNAKISSSVTNWLTLRFVNRLTTEQRDRPEEDLGLFYHNIARRWPVLPARDPNGNYFYESEIPVVIAGKITTKNLGNVSQLGFDFEPVKNWVTTADFNFKWNFYNQDNVRKRELYYLVDGTLQETNPNNTYIRKMNSNTYYFSPNIYSSYDFRELIRNNDHYLKLMLGFQQELYTYDETWSNKTNLVAEQTPAINTAVGTLTGNDSKYEWATRGFFGRLNYNYKEKYLVELNGRYDGSSKFPTAIRWGFFPSASFGWNIAREDFFRNTVGSDKINDLKLRFSYGSLGNQSGLINSNYYPYISTLSTINQVAWLFNGSKYPSVNAPSPVSNNVTWEKPTTINFGLNVSALRRRLTLDFDYFIRKTVDMMGPQSAVPLVVGANPPLMNNANLKTEGIELVVNWSDKIGDKVDYYVKGILNDYKSTILKYYNPTKSLSTYYEGMQVGEIWGFETAGLFQSADDVTNWLKTNDQSAISSATWLPGDLKYKDITGDGKVTYGKGTVDDHGDRKIIGNTTPRYSYSLNYGANWKGLSFSMFWQGVAKRQLPLSGAYMYGASGGLWQSAAFVQHLDYWTPENPNAYYPRPTFDRSGRNQETNDRYLQNAAYLRLKNITLGYQVPVTYIERFKVKRLGVFFSAENVLTVSKMNKIFDPEVTSNWDWGKVYPLSKTYSFGFNIGL